MAQFRGRRRAHLVQEYSRLLLQGGENAAGQLQREQNCRGHAVAQPAGLRLLAPPQAGGLRHREEERGEIKLRERKTFRAKKLLGNAQNPHCQIRITRQHPAIGRNHFPQGFLYFALWQSNLPPFDALSFFRDPLISVYLGLQRPRG